MMISLKVGVRTLFLLIFALSSTMAAGRAASNEQPAKAPTLQGTVYYVAVTGNDSNPGTAARPWRTIQKAANTLTAGDTVYIRAGVYYERVVPQNSGSAGSAITYAAYPGETATIDGSGVTLPDDLEGLFHIQSQSYIIVSGLRVINAGPHDNNAGIMVLGSSHIVVERNSTYNTNSSGIGVWRSDHVTVDGNRVEEAGGGGWQECISVAETDTFEVRNNEVLNCHKEGIDAKDGSSNGQIYRNHVHHTQRVGIYVDAFENHTYNIAVYQNVVHDIQDNDGFAIGSEQGGLLENVRVYNNIAYHNRYRGLTIHSCCPDSPIHPVRDITVINNTFYDNGWTDWGGGIAVDNPDAQNVVVRNNIVSQNFYFQIAVDPSVPTQNYIIDHNLIDGYRDHGDEGETRGDDYVEGDPQFIYAPGANFYLQANSPAIDAGSALDAPDDDFDGYARPQDGDEDGIAIHDIGADEFVVYTESVYLPIVLRQD